MSKFYEEKLPEGYTEELVIDSNDRESSRKLMPFVIITGAVLFNALFFIYVLPYLDEVKEGFSVLKFVVFVFSYFLYITLHELTHGAVYKIMTKQKLTFGFKYLAAYCGVPDIYFYRKTSLFSLLAPFTLFSVIFAAAFIIVDDKFSGTLILVLFSLHATGCVNDLYGAGLLISRFKDPSVLRKDTGPKQIYYTKG